jgi:hypothetical protein
MRGGTFPNQIGASLKVARIETVTLISDLDQSTADETVTFGLDGKNYQIDLSEGQAGQLRELLSPYLAASRRAGNGTGGNKARAPRASAHRGDQGAVRAWARDNGYPDLADRGRVPAKVLQAYAAAH